MKTVSGRCFDGVPLQLKLPPRPIRLEIKCAGMAAEILGAEVCGIPVVVQGLAEPKPAARRFLQQNWGRSGIVKHMFFKNEALFNDEGGGMCYG